jgi:hypothetical protein
MKLRHLLFAALGTIVLGGRADAQVLYGATAGGGAGELFILDPATGATIQDVGPLNDALGTNYGITGLAFSPVTGLLYGSVANSSVTTRAQLVTINPATALVTPIGPFNAGNTGSRPATMSDLAFNATGNLFGIGSVGGPQLYAIDVLTGQATVIGSTGMTSTSGGGLAISPTGVFYGTPTSSRFGTYDPTTGAYTNIGAPGLPAGTGTGYAALAFNGNVLYGDDLGAPAHLVTIDPATATVTDIGPTVPNLDGIAFSPAPVPEPGTLALLLGPVAVGLIKAARRRKLTAN